MDIIFFAAIAFFIFFKLSKSLGKIDEEEKKQIEEKIAKKRAEILAVQNQIAVQSQMQPNNNSSSRIELENKEDEKILAALDQATKQNFVDILARCKISATFFINGAKSAFEMIIKAFCQGDLETLNFLLNEKIYQGFVAAINQRKTEEKTLTTNLISIEKAEVISATIFENNAAIVVKFISKQINYICDKNGQIIEGKKDEINEMTDVWTFKKDLTTENPNWLVCATSNS